jgi:hypothetical protein
LSHCSHFFISVPFVYATNRSVCAGVYPDSLGVNINFHFSKAPSLLEFSRSEH